MKNQNRFMEWGVREVFNRGERLGVVARFLLKCDRNDYIEKENADCKKRNALYHYVPVRFHQSDGGQ